MIRYESTSCYGPEPRRPEQAQTESGRTARHHNQAKRIPPYSNAAGEKERRK